jgi:hypothetical protein
MEGGNGNAEQHGFPAVASGISGYVASGISGYVAPGISGYVAHGIHSHGGPSHAGYHGADSYDCHHDWWWWRRGQEAWCSYWSSAHSRSGVSLYGSHW